MNKAIESVTATSHLSYLAGCLNAAKADLQRAQAAKMPADVIAALRDEVEAAQTDFAHEFKAVQVLEELATPAPVVASKPQRARCPHWKAIKRVYAIAKEHGLDVSKAGKARMRHEMENVLGKCVDSRGEYSGADWMRFGDAIKAGARW